MNKTSTRKTVTTTVVDNYKLDDILVISENLKTQDNRCTKNPIFHVQVRERLYGFDPQWSDEILWIDTEDGVMELPHPKNEEEEEAYSEQEFYVETGYNDVWKTVEVCFTEKGCEDHLELNGHNYRHYEETRIYADSIHRNPEMLAIRDFLMSQE